jgi:ribosomal protein S18 acetylase RimI-like enzyme
VAAINHQIGARSLQVGVADRKRHFHIRPATPADADAATPLIYLPMGRLADYLFGSDEPDRARCTLAKLFAQPQNRFSYEFTDVLEGDGEVVGLLLAYPGSMLGDLGMPMARQLREIIGFGGMFRLLRRSLVLMQLKETEADEFYIYTLAVRPDQQNGGLGKRLMAHAEKKARSAELSKCSLGVTLDNEGALRFYDRLGYKIVDTVRLSQLEERIGYPGYYRLVKRLPES